MANFTGAARTNYFRVKDAAAFKAWAKEHRISLVERDGLFALLGDESDSGDISLREDEETGERGEPEDVLPQFLADGEVCVLISAGHEKMRYVSGYAVAFDSTGRSVQVSLNSIYELAKEAFGKEPTRAEY